MLDLFAQTIKRSEILQYSKNLDFKECKQIIINIHRNHAFEPVESVISPFLHFAGLKATFRISSYDDSLNFELLDSTKADLEILWLDLSRYSSDIYSYLLHKLELLRSNSKAPICVVLSDLLTKELNLNTLLEHKILQCEIVSIKDMLSSYMSMIDMIDMDKVDITGTHLSNIACMKLAQVLGLSLIPSFVLPNIKAIIVDLDNTLYNGIIGEDGVESVMLAEEHKELQKMLIEYKNSGFLLAICSKNELADVENLFNTRKDFVLKLKDFSCIKANWEAKDKNIIEIAQIFNIGLDSMLFIDDNIAEIENVRHLGIKTLFAKNAAYTKEALKLYPQLSKNTIIKEDILRSADLLANAKRQELQNLTPQLYFENLSLNLDFSINDINNIQRITELLNKTNQFISNYTRPTITQVQEWLYDDNYCIISVAMKDRLSDSGNIAIIVGRMTNNTIEIIDIAVSCRALGRKLESIILFLSFELICKKLNQNTSTLKIYYQKGARNEPFLKVLTTINNNQAISQQQGFIETHRHYPDISGLSINIQDISVKEQINE